MGGENYYIAVRIFRNYLMIFPEDLPNNVNKCKLSIFLTFKMSEYKFSIFLTFKMSEYIIIESRNVSTGRI